MNSFYGNRQRSSDSVRGVYTLSCGKIRVNFTSVGMCALTLRNGTLKLIVKRLALSRFVIVKLHAWVSISLSPAVVCRWTSYGKDSIRTFSTTLWSCWTSARTCAPRPLTWGASRGSSSFSLTAVAAWAGSTSVEWRYDPSAHHYLLKIASFIQGFQIPDPRVHTALIKRTDSPAVVSRLQADPSWTVNGLSWWVQSSDWLALCNFQPSGFTLSTWLVL